MSDEGSAYGAAGVDLEAQETALAEVGKLAKETFTAGVLSDVGTFGGLFLPDFSHLEEPVLVASADGVGTKLTVARLAGDFSTVGRDLVNHCTNDILAQGAQPLFFLDYVAAGRLEPEAVVDLVRGVAAGCRENGCALLGGETAEMPGFYQTGDYDLVGFIVGVADRRAIPDPSRVREGDLLVGLPSAGLHTNGYSLARKILFEEQSLGVDDPFPGESGRTVGQVLLAPHLSYLRAVEDLLDDPGLHGIAHVTGGGLTDNLPRALPEGLRARIRYGSWKVPGPFRQLQQLGDVGVEEMLRVFNMGVGLVLVVAADSGLESRLGEGAVTIGVVESGVGGVLYEGL